MWFILTYCCISLPAAVQLHVTMLNNSPLVAQQILDDRTIELTFPANPDGKYLLKGGTPAVWNAFGLPDKWCSRLGEGAIRGKRCGVTQNIGPTARLQQTRLSQLA
jgi:hypothetical protein